MGSWDKTFPSGIPPKPRHRATASTVGTKVFIFGGCIDNNEQVDDLALFNTSMIHSFHISSHTSLAPLNYTHAHSFSDHFVLILIYRYLFESTSHLLSSQTIKRVHFLMPTLFSFLFLVQ